jgi:cell division protein FtsL
VETRKRLESMDKRIDTANSDIEDVRKQVHEIERIETFCNIADMIKQSLEILDLEKSQQ